MDKYEYPDSAYYDTRCEVCGHRILKSKSGATKDWKRPLRYCTNKACMETGRKILWARDNKRKAKLSQCRSCFKALFGPDHLRLLDALIDELGGV